MVVTGAPANLLTRRRNSSKHADVCSRAGSASRLAEADLVHQPFLRIPPFPGARARQLVEAPVERDLATDSAEVLAAELLRLRVGGAYWAEQPDLTPGCVIVRTPAAIEEARQVAAGRELILWTDRRVDIKCANLRHVHGACDPWHMIEAASALFTDIGDEVHAIAALCGVPVYARDPHRSDFRKSEIDPVELVDRLIPNCGFLDPFSGEPISRLEAAQLCGSWRELIDSNRELAGGVGFAFWKQEYAAPLLWGGSEAFRFTFGGNALNTRNSIAVWRAKTAANTVAELERHGARFVEVEDGFLRSRGLGADCVPPLSLTVDRLGAHFDPTKESELERLLQNGSFDDQLISRARELRCLIVKAGLGKYGRGGGEIRRPAGDRRHILVPGQVEDDRAVKLGGCGLSKNIELLEKVRAHAPDAFVLYKPHPDVLAGHRRGAIAERECLQFADQIVGDLPVASLIGMVDEIHVNTSLAGFEALMREKQVTTYGVPFYAGWGLTEDLGPVPPRRSSRRTLDELVAAALLLYPRYLDPVTRLPCPAEVLAGRLATCVANDASLLVWMRRVQGRLARGFGRFGR